MSASRKKEGQKQNVAKVNGIGLKAPGSVCNFTVNCNKV